MGGALLTPPLEVEGGDVGDEGADCPVVVVFSLEALFVGGSLRIGRC